MDLGLWWRLCSVHVTSNVLLSVWVSVCRVQCYRTVQCVGGGKNPEDGIFCGRKCRSNVSMDWMRCGLWVSCSLCLVFSGGRIQLDQATRRIVLFTCSSVRYVRSLEWNECPVFRIFRSFWLISRVYSNFRQWRLWWLDFRVHCVWYVPHRSNTLPSEALCVFEITVGHKVGIVDCTSCNLLFSTNFFW